MVTPEKMKVVLITGCSVGGTGFAICREFSSRGYKVYATARDITKMADLKTVANVELMPLDVTDDLAALGVVETIIEQVGRIDILVNNAGMACFGPILEVPLEQIKAVYDTNVMSILRVSRAVLPHMARQRSGLIVNISSIVGETPTPWSGVYASSKAAVNSITEVLQMECRPFNVKAMLVCPGGIKPNVALNASTRFELEPQSLYTPYLDNILKRMWSSQVPSSLTAEAFAKQVVDKATAANPPFYLTMGSHTTVFTIMKWVPRLWALKFMWNTFGKLKA
ncbi:NAD-P-binding protein [Mycena vulgaris]|nr:NAD-P-binding protein [Mycena vulgaris]